MPAFKCSNSSSNFLQDDGDFLYHLGINTAKRDMKKEFGDIKFVCLGGTSTRMLHLAELLRDQLELGATSLVNIGKPERFSMYKVGPVLCVNHGIGMASLSVVLVELLKLLHHAEVEDPILVRLGTSGGIGCEPGTVVVTDKCLDGRLKEEHTQYILGEERRFSSSFNQINEDLFAAGKTFDFPIISGNTMGVNDFYEEQGRMDGAFCCLSLAEKQQFLKRLLDVNVRNIEMESPCFGAICRRAGVRGAVCCVTLLDRIQEDQVLASKETLKEWESRPLRLIVEYVKTAINAGKK